MLYQRDVFLRSSLGKYGGWSFSALTHLPDLMSSGLHRLLLVGFVFAFVAVLFSEMTAIFGFADGEVLRSLLGLWAP